MAFSASERVLNSTKAWPFGRPDLGSVGKSTAKISPKCEKICGGSRARSRCDGGRDRFRAQRRALLPRTSLMCSLVTLRVKFPTWSLGGRSGSFSRGGSALRDRLRPLQLAPGVSDPPLVISTGIITSAPSRGRTWMGCASRRAGGFASRGAAAGCASWTGCVPGGPPGTCSETRLEESVTGRRFACGSGSSPGWGTATPVARSSRYGRACRPHLVCQMEGMDCYEPIAALLTGWSSACASKEAAGACVSRRTSSRSLASPNPAIETATATWVPHAPSVDCEIPLCHPSRTPLPAEALRSPSTTPAPKAQPPMDAHAACRCPTGACDPSLWLSGDPPRVKLLQDVCGWGDSKSEAPPAKISMAEALRQADALSALFW